MTITEYFTPYYRDQTKGMLNGGRVKNLLRVGDLKNVVSIGSKAAYDARSLFSSNVPYYRMYDVDGALSIGMSRHFIIELRRQLSGVVDSAEPSTFSPSEELFYTKYLNWVDGKVLLVDEDLLAVTTLDEWLVDEIRNIYHPAMDRDYDETHPWYKVLKTDEVI